MILALYILVFLLILGLLSHTPYVTRKTELFGVSIPSRAADHEGCRRLRASYRSRMLLSGGILAVVAALGFHLWGITSAPGALGFNAALFGCGLAGFLLYLACRRRAKRLKEEMGWGAGAEALLVVDTESPLGDTLSPAWLLLYLLIPVLTAMAIGLAWPYAADPVPLHYDALGRVDRTAPKTIAAVLPLLLSQALVLLVCAGAFFAVRHGKRQIDAVDPEASRSREKRFRWIMSASALFGGALIGIFFGGLQVLMLLGLSARLITALSLALTLGIALGAALLFALVGQGGSRLRAPAKARPGAVNRDDDRYWKLGCFYRNGEDPAVFVEKRFGICYTLNWARPASWIILGALLLVITGTVFFLGSA
ncbi:MAG: DUF5808 domain-containing protein [Treponema sp.]|jgi:uncharacterized membrane protein|nr:DUF5808 domain-containing protein [Treponema sp.]